MERFSVAGEPQRPELTDPSLTHVTAHLADVEAAAKGSTARQLAREYMAHNAEHGVSAAMIADRLRMSEMITAERTIRDWLAEDVRSGLAEKATHGRYRLCGRDAA